MLDGFENVTDEREAVGDWIVRTRVHNVVGNRRPDLFDLVALLMSVKENVRTRAHVIT